MSVLLLICSRARYTTGMAPDDKNSPDLVREKWTIQSELANPNSHCIAKLPLSICNRSIVFTILLKTGRSYLSCSPVPRPLYLWWWKMKAWYTLFEHVYNFNQNSVTLFISKQICVPFMSLSRSG